MRKRTSIKVFALVMSAATLFTGLYIRPEAANKTVIKTVKTGSNLSAKLAKGKITGVNITSRGHKTMLAPISGGRYHIASTGSFKVRLGNTTYKYVVKQRRQNGGSVSCYLGEAFKAPLGNSWTEPISGNKWIVSVADPSIATAKVEYDGETGKRTLVGSGKKLGETKVTLVSPCGVRAIYNISVKAKEERVITEKVVVSNDVEPTVVTPAPTPEVPANVSITVKYIYSDGSIARPTEVKQYEKGSRYTIVAPEISGYKPDKDSVAGTVDYDFSIVFTYSPKTGVVVMEDYDKPSQIPDQNTTPKAPTTEYAPQLFMTVGDSGKFDIPSGFQFITISGEYGIVTADVTGTSFTGNKFGYVEAVYADANGNKIILPIFVA